eukprot:349688-Chlamydomonas_euryale.AAC.1
MMHVKCGKNDACEMRYEGFLGMLRAVINTLQRGARRQGLLLTSTASNQPARSSSPHNSPRAQPCPPATLPRVRLPTRHPSACPPAHPPPIRVSACPPATLPRVRLPTRHPSACPPAHQPADLP